MSYEDPAVWFGVIVGLIVFFLIAYYFIRYVMAIDRQVKNQRHMVDLLEHIAKAQGVDEDKIKILRNVYKD